MKDESNKTQLKYPDWLSISEEGEVTPGYDKEPTENEVAVKYFLLNEEGETTVLFL